MNFILTFMLLTANTLEESGFEPLYKQIFTTDPNELIKHPTYTIVKSFEERVFSFYSRTIVNSQRLKTKCRVDVFHTKEVH
ncbi:hypothetical protein H5410_025416 [Solanum commersonii]|uniref:Uncharacterized protein n=1 Tax=Solanum commersonii TaxID=4109 RepID=A0A9J5YXW3_SOLCO|nr:hypothetical protein H5410_025416 [Solanum commersonii]